MISKEKFIAFLKYIGITNERHHAKAYMTYKTYYRKSTGNHKSKMVNDTYDKYRMSNYEVFLEKVLKYDEGLRETITEYLTYPEKRLKMDIEISKYGPKGVWAKSLGKVKA